jgi:ABC-type dipeptide/oligopeptide/nickel transport system permease component
VVQVVVRRVLMAVPVVVGVSAIIFFTLRVLPGDPVLLLTQNDPGLTKHQLYELEKSLGLTKPLLLQYWQFVVHALQGNLGASYETKQPVLQMIQQQALPTVELAAAASFLTTIMGIAGGVLAAIYRDRWVDSFLRVFSLLGASMPIFWTGPLLLLLFSFTLHWLPSDGSGSFRQLVLPAFSLALAGAGLVVRLVRNSMLEVMGNEFVSALRAKGVSEGRILLRHILRNALIPAVTVLALQVGGLLAGTVLTETIFGRQGIGNLLAQSVLSKDYPVIQACVLIFGTVYVVLNIIVDISYAYLDPRVRTAMTR